LILAGAPPQILLAEFTALPQTPSCILGGPTFKGKEGRGRGEERRREGRGKKGTKKGKTKEGKKGRGRKTRPSNTMTFLVT